MLQSSQASLCRYKLIATVDTFSQYKQAAYMVWKDYTRIPDHNKFGQAGYHFIVIDSFFIPVSFTLNIWNCLKLSPNFQTCSHAAAKPATFFSSQPKFCSLLGQDKEMHNEGVYKTTRQRCVIGELLMCCYSSLYLQLLKNSITWRP